MRNFPDFIRTKAWRTDPPQVYNLGVLIMVLSISSAGFLYGIEVAVLGGFTNLPSLKTTFGLEDNGGELFFANFISFLLAGAVFGSLDPTATVDNYGRIFSIFYVCIFTFLGVAVQAASGGFAVPFFFGRFVAGVGIGVASVATPIYICEISPRGVRGVLIGVFQLFVSLGSMSSFWINYGCFVGLEGDAAWILPVSLQVLPALALVIALTLCTESPRRFAMQGNWEIAAQALTDIRALPRIHPYIQSEIWEMRAQLDSDGLDIDEESCFTFEILREMSLIYTHRKRFLVCIVLMILQQTTGINALNHYAPTFFRALGLPGFVNQLFATGVYGVCGVIGSVVFLYLMVDTIGRKLSLCISAVSMEAAMYYLSFYTRFAHPSNDGAISAAGYIAFVAVCLFGVSFQLGWGPVAWVFISEIPTLRLRGLIVGLAVTIQWLFSLAIARLTPLLLANTGHAGYGTYFIFGSFCFASIPFVFLVIPETMGHSLEFMDDLFQDTCDDQGIGHLEFSNVVDSFFRDEGANAPAEEIELAEVRFPQDEVIVIEGEIPIQSETRAEQIPEPDKPEESHVENTVTDSEW